MKKNSLYSVFGFYFIGIFCLIEGYSPETTTADTFNVISKLPHFETTPRELEATVNSTLVELDKDVLCLKENSSGILTFNNTLGLIDEIKYEISILKSRVSVIKNTSTSIALQQKARELLIIINQWSLNFETQKEIYEIVERYALSEEASILHGEEKRLIHETICEFKRVGFHLNEYQFEQFKVLMADIDALSQQIISNLDRAGDKVIGIAKEEVLDIDPELLKAIQCKGGKYLIHKGNWDEITTFLRNSSNEALRKRIFRVYRERARKKNIELQLQVFKKRVMIAHLLGYQSWAEYKIEEGMAKNPETVLKFEENLLKNTEEKFLNEIEELRKIKIEETGNKDAKINSWDVMYYQTKYLKRNFDVNFDKLKKFFEYENTLAGMLKCYEQVFHLKIEKITDIPYKWHHSLELLHISDAQTEKPLGYLYLDMFPRKGKSGSFSHQSIIRGKLLRNGKYRRPVGILICNFPAPSKDMPSLLSWDHVKTLFHEFGHGLHNILTETKYYKFAGTNVPRDFVEAPSQMLEYFLTDKRVLDTFARNYQNPEEKISHEMLNNILKAEKATSGQSYRIQIMLGMLDLKLAMLEKDTDFINFDIVHYTNTIIKNYYLPYPEGTSLIANFRHPFIGYDGGYYGYIWADSLAADMASIFETSKDGFLNPAIGLKLRREIYEKGSSRDVEKSLIKFLGRKRNQDAFKRKLGISEKAWNL